MTTKELIKLLQQHDPDGDKEVRFYNEYGQEESIICVDSFDNEPKVVYINS